MICIYLHHTSIMTAKTSGQIGCKSNKILKIPGNSLRHETMNAISEWEKSRKHSLTSIIVHESEKFFNATSHNASCDLL